MHRTVVLMRSWHLFALCTLIALQPAYLVV